MSIWKIIHYFYFITISITVIKIFITYNDYFDIRCEKGMVNNA